ncbi:hypothetical protein PUW81_011580 [Microbacterium sp. NM3R9]|nr:hypothetical protein [Microbacterium thalli]MDN8549747.1 hypothetical protein [Microbacterium thalli]
MNVRYRYDRDRVIPVAVKGEDDEARRSWALNAAASYAEHIRTEVDLDATAVARVADLAAELARVAGGSRAAALLFLPEPQIAAPMTIMFSPEQPTKADQEDFLWPRSSLLRPTHRKISTDGLGAGSTVAIVHREHHRAVAERRWLFLGEHGSVAVALGPMAVPFLALVEPVSDLIIDSLSIDGYVADPSGRAATEIADAFQQDEERWAV